MNMNHHDNAILLYLVYYRTLWYFNFIYHIDRSFSTYPQILQFANAVALLLSLLLLLLQICSTGRFRGDVSFGSIVVENGGKLEGRVNFEGLRAPLSEATSTSSAPKRTSSTAPAAPAAAPVEIAKKDVDDESSPSPNPTLLESPPPSMTTASESTAPELDPTTASPEPEATASEPVQETSTKSEPAPSVATTPAEAPQGEGEGGAPTVSQASQPTAEESSPE